MKDNNNIQEISLDIVDNKTYDYLYAKQYDKGRELIFYIKENGQPVDLTGVSATFQMKKTDGTLIINSCNVSEDAVSITVTEQMTACHGKMPFQIVLIENDVVITIITGYLKIDESVVQPTDVESSDEFNIITEVLIEINNAKEAAANAKISEENAKSSETNAAEAAANAQTNADYAEESAASASDSANLAIAKATEAAASSETAATKAAEAESAANIATTKASEITTSAETAANSASEAATKASEAADSANLAQSYAIGTDNSVRENDATDNSKYYSEQAKEALSKMQSGQVTGVKGDNESDYRIGEVNLTKENIGLGNVDNTADADKNVAYAQNADTANKFGTETVGSTTTPVYVKDGVITATEKSFSDYLPLTGGTMSGTLYHERVNFLQATYGDYGLLFRKDNSAFYLLITNEGDSKGDYNSLRPLMLNLSTGAFSLGHQLYVSDVLTANSGLAINNENGLVFSTYGGGWYMTDSNWIRAIGNKGIYTAGEIKTDNTLYAQGIELNHSTSWIDFHKDNSTADFTSRLIENVTGSLYLYANGGSEWGWFHAAGYTVESSKHVKTNIENMTDEEALKLLDLRVVSFDYKNGTKDKRGLIAEEAYKILPQIVQMPTDYDEDTFEYKEGEFNNTPSIDYGSITPYLIKLVQLQQQQLDSQNERISQLENTLASILEKLS